MLATSQDTHLSEAKQRQTADIVLLMLPEFAGDSLK